MDILYFGYSYGPDEGENRQLESEFIEEFESAFPDVEIRDAYDSIKGYRRSVYYDNKFKDDYLTWIMGKGWLHQSLHFQVMMLDENQIGEFKRLMDLTKIKYPEAFKPESLKS